MRPCLFALIFLFLLSSCAAPTPTPTQVPTSTSRPTQTPLPTNTPTYTPTSTAIPTFTPTPTPDPMGDPDGDGYPTSFEEAWGTAPFEFTTFDELQVLPEVITGILHTREPYNLEDMNRTIYQQVRLIDEKLLYDRKNPWNKIGPFGTLTVEFVLFPYVADIVDEYVRSLNIPYEFPKELEQFTQPSETSDTCKEEMDMMAPITQKSKTLYELGNRINEWNWENLDNDFKWGNNEGQKFRASITTCEMMQLGKIGSCMVFATKMVSDFREAGIPIGIAFSYTVSDVDIELHNRDLYFHTIRSNFHPQNAIWTPRYGWIIYQYLVGFSGTREPPYYVGLFFTQIATDWKSLNTTHLFAMEYGQGFEWFYYMEDLSAPSQLLQYLQPAD